MLADAVGDGPAEDTVEAGETESGVGTLDELAEGVGRIGVFMMAMSDNLGSILTALRICAATVGALETVGAVLTEGAGDATAVGLISGLAAARSRALIYFDARGSVVRQQQPSRRNTTMALIYRD